MAELRFNENVLSEIRDSLDNIGLFRAKSEIVVVGGSALAAYGIKDIKHTDLDIVVTADLMEHLSHDDRWRSTKRDPIDDPAELVADKAGIAIKIHSEYEGLTTVHGELSAIKMPLDKIYDVSSDHLISQGQSVSSGDYRYLPPSVVLDWKLALIESADYEGNKNKHVQDARRIAKFLGRVSRPEISLHL